MSIIPTTTPIFTGVPPVTINSTSHPDGQFTIPNDWNNHCRQDHDWCRHFIEEAIKNLQLPSLFPGVTLVPAKKISPTTLRDIKDRCKANVTCYDEAVKAEQIKLTEDYLMGRFPSLVTVSTSSQLQIVFAIGLLCFFFAILGGALLFYFVFMPHDQIGCSFGIPFLDDDPPPEGGPLPLPPPPLPSQEPFQGGMVIPAPAPGPVPGQAVLPGQNLPMTVNQGFISTNSKSKGRSSNSKKQKSSKKSKKQSKSKKKVSTRSSKKSSKNSKKVSKSSKSKKKKK